MNPLFMEIGDKTINLNQVSVVHWKSETEADVYLDSGIKVEVGNTAVALLRTALSALGRHVSVKMHEQEVTDLIENMGGKKVF